MVGSIGRCRLPLYGVGYRPVEDIPEALVSALHHQWNQSVNTQDACSALLLRGFHSFRLLLASSSSTEKMFAPRGAFAEFVIAIDFWADFYRTVDDREKPLLDEVGVSPGWLLSPL